jgi:DNA-binding transcriptional ArsR family regulator
MEPIEQCSERLGANGSNLAELKKRLHANEHTLRRIASQYALLAGETRLKILALLECAGELCVCDLAEVLSMTPAAVSQHLSRLRSEGMVVNRRDGMTVFYRRGSSPLLVELCIPDLVQQARRTDG